VLRDPIIKDALALDHLVLLGIEGRGIVLEMLDQGARFRALIEDLRLAFIDAATAAHRSIPWFVYVHWCRGSSVVRGPRRRRRQAKWNRRPVRSHLKLIRSTSAV